VTPRVRVAFFDAGGPAEFAANQAGQVAFAWMTTDPRVQPITSIQFATFTPGGAPALCSSTPQALCLLGSQYSVTVTFHESAGSPAAPGQAVQLSGDGGYYWFFSPDDAELAVKILDGTAVNGHVWVFYASLTDVEFDLAVTDLANQVTRTYHNPAGMLASAADTSAF
jgi:hypothetical protein